LATKVVDGERRKKRLCLAIFSKVAGNAKDQLFERRGFVIFNKKESP